MPEGYSESLSTTPTTLLIREEHEKMVDQSFYEKILSMTRIGNALATEAAQRACDRYIKRYNRAIEKEAGKGNTSVVFEIGDKRHVEYLKSLYETEGFEVKIGRSNKYCYKLKIIWHVPN